MDESDRGPRAKALPLAPHWRGHEGRVRPASDILRRESDEARLISFAALAQGLVEVAATDPVVLREPIAALIEALRAVLAEAPAIDSG